jgi:O-methyltransferase
MTPKKIIKRFLHFKGYKIVPSFDSNPQTSEFKRLYNKYSDYTMIPEINYVTNLELAYKYAKQIEGDIVECGVWKGGMIAGIAEVLGSNRTYYLFDSFEGLPEVKEIDGDTAKRWQQNTIAENYYNNCRAAMEDAETAMKRTHCNYRFIKGWFNETLPGFEMRNRIALLRLDGDWYESTMDCLKYLYPGLADKGLLLIDDYFAWEGCSRAVHDYLSEINSTSRIRTCGDICYIIKNENRKG